VIKNRFRREDVKINKAILFAFSLFLFSFIDLGAAELNLKSMIGWSHSNLDYEGIKGINRITSGIGFEIWIIKNLGFEIDAMYVKKGYYCSSCETDKVFTEISIPLLIKSRVLFGKGSHYKFSVFGGFEYSPILTEMDPYFGQHDLGIVVGSSLERSFEKVGFFVEMRYDWGLLEQSDEYLPRRFEFKTRTLYVMTGIKIRL
jgi:hypothetical protein